MGSSILTMEKISIDIPSEGITLECLFSLPIGDNC